MAAIMLCQAKQCAGPNQNFAEHHLDILMTGMAKAASARNRRRLIEGREEAE